MKILTNKNNFKKIAILLIVIMSFNFIVPINNVEAKSHLVEAGGKLLDPIVSLLMYVGDAILSLLQNNFLTTHPILMEAQADDYAKFNGWALLATIVSALTFVAGICLAIPTGGTSLVVSIKVFAIGAAVVAGSSYVFHEAGSKFLEDLAGNFDIPMIEYTPYAIFSGQIPALDINFIKPMEKKYSTRLIEETTIKEDYNSIYEWENFAEFWSDLFAKVSDEDFKTLVEHINANGFKWTELKKGTNASVYPGYTIKNVEIEDGVKR